MSLLCALGARPARALVALAAAAGVVGAHLSLQRDRRLPLDGAREASPRCSRTTASRALSYAHVHAVPRQAAVALARQPVLRPRFACLGPHVVALAGARSARALARAWSGAAARSAWARARRRRALGGRALRGAVLAREPHAARGRDRRRRAAALPPSRPAVAPASARRFRGRGPRGGGGGGGGAKGLSKRARAARGRRARAWSRSRRRARARA